MEEPNHAMETMSYTCSSHSIKPTMHMVESTQQQRDGLVAWEILMDQSEKEEVLMQEEQY